MSVMQLELDLLRILAERFTDVAGDTKIKTNIFLDHLSAQMIGKAQTRSLFNLPAIANTDIFDDGQDLKPKLLSSLWRCQIQADGAAIVSLNTIVDGKKQTSLVLNGVALAAGIPKSFDFQSTFGNRYNFEMSASVKIEHLYIEEIPINA